MPSSYVVNLRDVTLADVKKVGGKNASLGEMIHHLSQKGIRIPHGFATTISAYRDFLAQHALDKKIDAILSTTDFNDFKMLQYASSQIRQHIMEAEFSHALIADIHVAYDDLPNKTVAVRSSAIAEDSDIASFAGMQETFLNIHGHKALLHAIKLVFASLFTHRAITYRHKHHIDHHDSPLSVGVIPMIRSDKGASGVVFTLDTESGFNKVMLISASYGLGEALVQGRVNPDEFTVYKPNVNDRQCAILQRKLGEKHTMMVYGEDKNASTSTKMINVPVHKQTIFCLNDEDIEELARQALLIEAHYGKPMDIEWAKDGIDGKIYILQARPETTHTKLDHSQKVERYLLGKKTSVLTKGQSIGRRVGQGIARIILNIEQAASMQPGDVLVTDMTDPDWEPIMKMANAIVTNRGGRTCHAAIIARELGIPAIVGCMDATNVIENQTPVTISCCEGLIGYVYQGHIPYEKKTVVIDEMPKLKTKMLLNMGSPEKAFECQFLPNDGVGLARLEFIIGNTIGLHPNAALDFNQLPKALQNKIKRKTLAYDDPVHFYVEKLREGMSIIAAAFYPKEVIFRFSDFKSNEYANLLGGKHYEPLEENPMIGFRGASRYKDKRFEKCFGLECEAFKQVREKMGLMNAQMMIPFVRTLQELHDVMAVMEKYGIKRGENGVRIYMMCEIPSNVLLADEFLKYVDGFSIGSNDLTQLTLGLDRDSNMVASSFDERNHAVKKLLREAIAACHRHQKYIGICGQGPSDHPDFAKWLMEEGIQSISLTPDTIVETWLTLGVDNATVPAVTSKRPAC